MSKDKIISAVIIAAGLMGAACLLGAAVRDFKAQDRYVTVKGLAVRDVRADLATWNLGFDISGHDLLATLAEAKKRQELVLAYLVDGGIPQEEINVNTPSVFDRHSQTYSSGNDVALKRYVIKSTLSVRTPKVDALKALSANVGSLIANGIVFSPSGCPDPVYAFTGLNGIKAEMLAEAMKNTRLAAAKFAEDSQSHVGQIRRANQGVFSIVSSSIANQENEGDYCGVDINKTVRLVTTVDYFLKD